MNIVPVAPAITAPAQTPDTYQQFLRAKIKFAPETGIEIHPSEVNPLLKPHQRDIVIWAIRGGRRAIFAAFGLGKTWIQVEILRILQKHTGGHALLVCPLGVRQEFVRDAAILGVTFRFVRTNAEVTGDHHFYLTNYESVRERKLSPDLFNIASLDEASVLRSFGSDTYQSFLTLFVNVPYRFVATATPSPNKHKELIHYAGFLGAMDTGQALTRFFARNSEKASDLTLYPHKEQEFWLWVSSWAVFIEKPSDLGYSDDGYDLPKLKIIYHELPSTVSVKDIETNGQTLLFRDAAMGLSAAASEKRDSLTLRINKMLEIVGNVPDDNFLLWHDLEDERRAIEKALPQAVSVYGSQDLDTREANIIGFSDGSVQYLAAKPVMCGSGCNFQRHCHKAIFLGVGYKFNDWIQAIKRIHRFLQSHECEIHIIHTEAEREILRVLQAKWVQHEEMVTKMTEIIREHGLSRISLQDVLTRTIGVERVAVTSKLVGLDGRPYYTVVNNDCVLEARRLATNSIQCIITSIPFANQYEYTPSYNDFGHTDNNSHFWQQMDFLTPELFRILEPGRLFCCHVKDRILFGNQTGTGMPTVAPFHAEAIFHGMKHGFQFMGMITVVTDVVRENNQTYRLGWSEQCKDGSKMGIGMPEYVLLFRKLPSDTGNSYADNPVQKDKQKYTRARWQVDAHSFWRSSGNRLITAEEMAGYGTAALAKMFTQFSLEHVYDYDFHVKIGEELDMIGALPSSFMCLAPGSHAENVWHDVARMQTLNNNQTQRGLQQHMCPLQFDIVDRLIERYTNPGDLILDPFCGISTVPYRAILKGRRGYGSELNPEYFTDGLHYLRSAEEKIAMPALFDLEGIPQASTAKAIVTPKQIDLPEQMENEVLPDSVIISRVPESQTVAISDGPVSSTLPPVPIVASCIPPPPPGRNPATLPDVEGNMAMASFTSRVRAAGYIDRLTTGGTLDQRKACRAANAVLGRVASDKPQPTPDEFKEAALIVKRISEDGFSEIAALENLPVDVAEGGPV